MNLTYVDISILAHSAVFLGLISQLPFFMRFIADLVSVQSNGFDTLDVITYSLLPGETQAAERLYSILRDNSTQGIFAYTPTKKYILTV